MKDEKFILYVQTSDVPERQYSPLVLAQTAKNMDLNPKIYYMGQALKILLPGEAEKIKLGNFPSIWVSRFWCARHPSRCLVGKR